MRKPQVVPDEDHERIWSGWPRWTWPRRPGWCACAPRTRPGRAGSSDRIWDDVPATRARIAELGGELLGPGADGDAGINQRLLADMVLRAGKRRAGGPAGLARRRPRTCKGRAEDRQAGCDVAGPADPAGAAAAHRSCRRPRSGGCGTSPGPGTDLVRERTRCLQRLEKLLLRHEALLLPDGGERPSISPAVVAAG